MMGAMVFALVSCNEDEDTTMMPMEYNYDFESGLEQWIPNFADYPVGDSISYELLADHTMLPDPLDDTEGAIKISGKNMSDDLFMFMKKKVSGLVPNTTYSVWFNVTFASNVPDNMAGVGGSPGESVYIKAGATSVEPMLEEDNMGYYRMNIDKGNQSTGGSDMIVLGDFSNDTDMEEYTLKTVGNTEGFAVTSNENGEAWLIVGTESGFEATTTIYYDDIYALFEHRN